MPRDYAQARVTQALQYITHAAHPLTRAEIARGIRLGNEATTAILRELTDAGQVVRRKVGQNTVKYTTPDRLDELQRQIDAIRAAYVERHRQGLTLNDEAVSASDEPVQRRIPPGAWRITSLPAVRSVFDLGAQQ